MIQRINAPVSVDLYFDHYKRRIFPRVIFWERKYYPVVRVGLHHVYRVGRTLYHVFSVETKELFFRLVLNTDNLHWRVEEIADGEAN